MAYRVIDALGARVLLHPDGRRLLAGPEPEVSDIRAALNAHPPATDAALRQALSDLIAETRDCSFAPLDLLDEDELAEVAGWRRRGREGEARLAQLRLL